MLDSVIMQSLLRTTPVAVSGIIESYRTDRAQDSFTLTYNQDKEFDAPTEIFIHKPFKEIITDGEYTFEAFENSEAGILKVKTSAGKHEITVQF